MMWKDLTPEEEKVFRRWARHHYVPHTPINPMWHPVVRDECEKINKEKLNG